MAVVIPSFVGVNHRNIIDVTNDVVLQPRYYTQDGVDKNGEEEWRQGTPLLHSREGKILIIFFSNRVVKTVFHVV